ncbi:MAG TPA: hypothetical protein VFZ97_04135 [Acidimicrobiales bacterium]
MPDRYHSEIPSVSSDPPGITGHLSPIFTVTNLDRSSSDVIRRYRIP